MKTLQTELCKIGLATLEDTKKEFFFLQEPALAYLEEVRERTKLVRRSKSIKAKKIEPKKMKNGRIVYMRTTDLKIMGSKGYKILELIHLYKEIQIETIKDSVGVCKSFLFKFVENIISKGFIIKEKRLGRRIIYKWNTPLLPLDVYKQSVDFQPEKKKDVVFDGMSGLDLQNSFLRKLSGILEIKISGRIEIVFKIEVGR